MAAEEAVDCPLMRMSPAPAINLLFDVPEAPIWTPWFAELAKPAGTSRLPTVSAVPEPTKIDAPALAGLAPSNVVSTVTVSKMRTGMLLPDHSTTGPDLVLIADELFSKISPLDPRSKTLPAAACAVPVERTVADAARVTEPPKNSTSPTAV